MSNKQKKKLLKSLQAAMASSMLLTTVVPSVAEVVYAKDLQESNQAKAEEQKTEETKAEEQKTEETKVEEQKTEETKVEEQKTEETKAEEQKTEETKAEEQKVEETKTEETKAEEQKTEETKTEETKTEEEKVEEATTDENVALQWGTALAFFDTTTGTFTVQGGSLGKYNESPWNEGKIEKAEVKKIVFKGKAVAPEDSNSLFWGLSNLTEIEGLNLVDTSRVTNMKSMFSGLGNLKQIDLSKFNTSKVTNMNSMFYNGGFEQLDLTSFDTSNVTNMGSMFSGNGSLTEVNVSSFDTSNVTTMSAMFKNTKMLSGLNVTNFNTSNVTSMESMFLNTANIGVLDLTNFDTNQVTDMSDMLAGSQLTSLTLGEKFRFKGEVGLGNPTVSEGTATGKWARKDGKSKEYTPAEFMKNYGTGDLTAGEYVDAHAVKYWGTSAYSFDEKTGTLTLDGGTLDVSSKSPWNRNDSRKIDASKIKKLVIKEKTVAPANSVGLFSGLTNLTGLTNVTGIEGLNLLDTSNVTSMNSMFSDLSSLTTLDVSNFDTSNVTSMYGMFSGLSSLTTLDVSNFDTSNVTDMIYMFTGLSSLTTLDVSNFDTSKVTNMQSMFWGMSSLTTLDVSNFDTSNVTNMSRMFYGLRSLTTLDVSNFDTSNVKEMNSMFYGQSSIESLKLGDKFRFASNADLEAPKVSEGTATGKWTRKDGKSKEYTPAEFMKNYGTGDLTAGEYVDAHAVKYWGTSAYSFDEATGTLTLDGGTLSGYKESPWNRADDRKIDGSKIKKIVFKGKAVAPEDSYSLFWGLSNLTEIEGLNLVDTSRVTNMKSMFSGLENLKQIDLSKFNTSKVTNMNSMFYSGGFEQLDLTSFDTSNVTDMGSMFSANRSLTEVNVSSFDTSNVTTMSAMFKNTTMLSGLNVSNFDTSNVTDMDAMFYGQSSIESLKLGDKFRFASNAGLEAPKVSEGTATGKWTRKDGKSKEYTPAEFMKNYGTGELTAGEYVDAHAVTHWGTSPYSFDEKTGTLTLDGGTLGESKESPWNRTDERKIDAEAIKKIVFKEKIFAPENSNSLFLELYNVSEIEGLNLLDTSRVTTMKDMFHHMRSLKTLDLSKFDTSKVTNMQSMFWGMSALKTLDISKFDTSKVTNMAWMFKDVTSLKTLDISNFDTSKVTLMTAMFQKMNSLENLVLGDKFSFKGNADAALGAPNVSEGTATGKWTRKDGKSKEYTPAEFMKNYGTGELTAGEYVDAHAVTHWGTSPYSFDEKTGTLTLDGGTLGKYNESPWNEGKIEKAEVKKIVFKGKAVAPEDSNSLFWGLSNLTEIEGLNLVDTSRVINMKSMFSGLGNLKQIDLSKFNTSKVTNMNSMFYSGGFEQLDLTSFDTSNVTNMGSMFSANRSLTEVNVSSFDTSNVTTMSAMFKNTTMLSGLNVSNFDTSNVTDMDAMFYGQSSIESLKLGDKFRFASNAGLEAPKVSEGTATGKWARKDGKSKEYTPAAFMKNYGTGDLTAGEYVDARAASYWGTSAYSFDEKTGTLTLDGGTLSGYKESPWKREDDRKIDGSKIKKLVFKEKTVAPANSDSLFMGLSNLTEIEGLNLLDTSNVTNMSQMFYGLSSLKTLDVSNFDTSNVTSMNGMFRGLSSLKTLDVSNFDTSNVTAMYAMFYDLSSLKTLDVSNFDTSNVKDMNYMFGGQSSIESLKLGDKFRFASNAGLAAPNVSEGTAVGKWARKDGKSKEYTPAEFMKNYGTGDLTAGEYVDARAASYWGTSAYSFDEATGTLTLDGGTLSGYKESPWQREDDRKIDGSKIKKLVIKEKTVAPADSNSLFLGLTNLTEIEGLPLLDTSNVTNMKLMFTSLENLKQIDLSKFNTNKVVDMSFMFYGIGVENLDLTSFDTSNVTNMDAMLSTVKLKNLNLSNFDTSKVTSMQDMLFLASELESLVLGDKFRFKGNESLESPTVSEGTATGKWARKDGKSKAYTPEEFMKNYGTGDLTAGEYVDAKNV
ncbi:BspA family leucine-rich repeat surface protein, partial [Enterococcus faecalis]|uniref:BspA family leucine-rich repeat surface protein n=1 Tax=Enterococcus faecalis TaxID=1351 RepID=UPI0025B1F828